MSNTLQSIIGYTTLTGLIDKVKTGVPNPYPPKLFEPTKKCIGDAGRYTQVTGTRQTARLTQYGAAARRRKLRDIAVRDVKLMHTLEEQPLPPLVLQQLRDYDNYNNMQLGKQEVARQTKQFGQLFKNLEISAVAMVLANGRIGFDLDGNMLPDSSWASAVEQVTFGMSANNQGNLNGLIPTGKGWQNNVSDIPGQIRAIKRAAWETTGYELKYAFYGINIPTYMNTNAFMLEYLARNPKENADFMKSGEVGQLFDLTWIPTYISFFNDQNEAVQRIWPDDNVTFAPEIGDETWDYLEGSYLVPKSINVVTDAEAALANLEQVWGSFSYGIVTHNPPGITQFGGTTFLPVMKNPDAFFQAVVKQ